MPAVCAVADGGIGVSMEEMEYATALRVQEAANRLLGKLEQAVKELDAVVVKHREKCKTDDGEHVTEYEERLPRKKGLVNQAGLKQLTSVLKDLQDILCSDPAMDLREREVRIQKLEQELNRSVDSEGFSVVLEGEAEGYAG